MYHNTSWRRIVKGAGVRLVGCCGSPPLVDTSIYVLEATTLTHENTWRGVGSETFVGVYGWGNVLYPSMQAFVGSMPQVIPPCASSKGPLDHFKQQKFSRSTIIVMSDDFVMTRLTNDDNSQLFAGTKKKRFRR